MHLITGSCVLFLWIRALTSEKIADCTLDQFVKGPLYDSNFDTTDLEASYPAGKQLRVSCNIGFSGFFKLLCVEGEWHPRGTKCQARSCGHPGDAQFAEFHLEKGEDFVFGSQVAYTCHKGYQMVSRTNYRRCMAGGWDGVVPVCEAQQCPVIHVSNNVQVVGDPEEASYGNVVQFSCKSSSEVLIGSQEVYCNEFGEWSGEAPKCKAINCLVPVIENGYVPGNIQEYKEHEILHFVCDWGFKPTQGRPSKCTKLGIRAEWSPTPDCELIKCKLSIPRLEGTRYEPANRNVFSVGDTIRVRCGERYWISDPRQTSAQTTCKDDGEWTVEPVCKGIKVCTLWWFINTLKGVTVSYTCYPGYKRTNDATTATCTRDGWSPDPLCEEITCDRREIQNTVIVNHKDKYHHNEKANYVCNNGYKGSFHLNCRENGWNGYSQCTEITCDRREIQNTVIVNHKDKYRYNEKANYVCNNGYEGSFHLNLKSCEKHDISNAYILRNEKKSYRHHERVQYACRTGDERRFTVVCDRGVWTGIQSCTVPHGFAVGPYGGKLYYTCHDGYKLATKGWWGEATCIGTVWSGLDLCIANSSCGRVPLIPNSKMISLHNYGEGKSVQITCQGGYTAQVDRFTCMEGNWDTNGLSLDSICTPTVGHCSPPPKVVNAIVVTVYQSEYLSGSEVTYQCRYNYTMEGQATIKCDDGNWQQRNITCTRTPTGTSVAQKTVWPQVGLCTAARGKMRLSLLLVFLQLWGGVEVSSAQDACSKIPDVPHASVSDETNRAEYPEGHLIHFTCETGYISGLTIRYVCTSAGWVAVHDGKCYLKPCQLPDDTPNGHYQLTHGDDFVFGSTIKYFCNEGYHMVSKDDTRTCLLDKWTNHVPICDPLSCDPPPDDAEITVQGLPQNDDPVLPDRFLTFSCDGPGKQLNGSSRLICGNDGQWDKPFPSCEDISCKADEMDPNLRADGLLREHGKMKIGHRIIFHCEDGYSLEGAEQIQCLQTGQWNVPFPTCIEKCKVTEVPFKVHIDTYVPGHQLTKGQKLRFSCSLRSHILRGKAEVECLAGGQWSDPFPTCGAPLGCGKPPSLRRRHNDKVEHICQPYYVMRGGPFKTCSNGEWTGDITCIRPCTVDREAMNKRNISFRYSRYDKLYATHDEEIEFRCNRGRKVGRVAMRQRCDDGAMELPSCY
uniref:Sushi domain-containing protein n=1 Tax=Scophthalmus maximus TaxID=52904 RepID=A0A8D3B9K5_SCOMX